MAPNIECHYAECCDYLNVMLSVVRQNVVMLSAVAPNIGYLQLSFQHPDFIGKLFRFGLMNLGLFVPRGLDFFPGLRLALNLRPELRFGLGQPIPVLLHFVEFAPEPTKRVGADDTVVQPDAEKCAKTC